MAGMRFISLLVVVAIIYVAYSRRVQDVGPKSRVSEAIAEADKVMPLQPPQPAAAPQGGGLRTPVDRTRKVMELVKARNGE